LLSFDRTLALFDDTRQTRKLSTTYPEKIHLIAQRGMTDRLKVEADTTQDDASIQPFFCSVKNHGLRITALRLLLLQNLPEPTLIFCNTKRETGIMTEKRQEDGFSALALHGDLEQKKVKCWFNLLIKAFPFRPHDVVERGFDINKILPSILSLYVRKFFE
jgi:ATP-dependent RNA helicase DbpA